MKNKLMTVIAVGVLFASWLAESKEVKKDWSFIVNRSITKSTEKNEAIINLLVSKLKSKHDQEIYDYLTGPPKEAETKDKRYFFIDGCLQHACFNTGFLWIDLESRIVIGGHQDRNSCDDSAIVTSDFKFADQLPEQFFISFNKWNNCHKTAQLYFKEEPAKNVNIKCLEVTPKSEICR